MLLDLSLAKTILRDLSALKYIPALEKAFTHLSKRFCAPETDKGIKLKSP